MELVERLTFFLIGMGLGFICGYVVARLRVIETKLDDVGSEVHEVDTIVKHEREHLPAFILVDLALRFPLSDLFVERVKELLTRRGSGKRRAMKKSSPKAPKVKQPLGSTIEHDAHSVKQINNLGRILAHRFYWRLVCEEVTTINRLVKM